MSFNHVNERPDSRQGNADLLDRQLLVVDAMRVISEGELKITLNEIQEAMSYAWDELTRYGRGQSTSSL
jgi:hypothetical protein